MTCRTHRRPGRLRSGDIDLLTDRYLTTFHDGLTHDRITIGKTETMRIDFPRFSSDNGIEVPASLLESVRGAQEAQRDETRPVPGALLARRSGNSSATKHV